MGLRKFQSFNHFPETVVFPPTTQRFLETVGLTLGDVLILYAANDLSKNTIL